jgi:hypothetical protein
MFLWILGYCIHDAESLHNLKTFLSPDTFTTSETMIECPLLTADFFSKHLLSSVESIVHDIIGNKQEFLCQKIREHYTSLNQNSSKSCYTTKKIPSSVKITYIQH